MTTYAFKCEWCDKKGLLSGTEPDPKATLQFRTLKLKSQYHIDRNDGQVEKRVIECVDIRACESRELKAEDAREKMLRDSRRGQAGWDE